METPDSTLASCGGDDCNVQESKDGSRLARTGSTNFKMVVSLETCKR